MYKTGVFWRTKRIAAVLFSISVVTALMQLPALADSVTLAWLPSADPSVTGYKIYYGVASRTYTNVVDVGNATNATVSGLVAGTTYYFAATAYNSLGMESSFSAEVSYTVPITTAGNQPPTLDPLNNLTINENAGLQTVNLSGITNGAATNIHPITITAVSSNPGLIPNPTVSYTNPNTTGTLTFTPVIYGNGTAKITVTVNNGQATNNTTTQTFTVTVNPVNQPPTLNPLNNLTINENAGLQTVNLSGITSGATNEIQTLTVTATSSKTSLIPNPTVSYTNANTNGTLTFTPVANGFGQATITVTVNDGGASNNIVTRTFTVTVNAVNQPPTLNPLNNLTINENAGVQTVSLSGITSGATNEIQTLTVTATSGNPSLIPNPTVTYTSPNTNGTLTFTPAANGFGQATITVTVNDGGASNNIVTRTFTITVNSPPAITTIANQTIATNASTGPLSFTVSDAETPAANLALWAVSSTPALIPTNSISFGGSGSNRTVTLTPLPNQSGNASITITVSDGSATAGTTFQLTVLAPPPPPSMLTIVTNGSGTVTPNLMKQKLTVGKTYTLTATPAAGQVFAGWTGDIISSSQKLTFLMRSHLVVQANFIPSPFIPVSGAYNGLFNEGDGVRQNSAGFFTATITTRGTYSGRLQIGARRYSFSGQLNLQLQATNAIPRRGTNALVLQLTVGTGNQANEISGQVTDGFWVAGLSGDRAVFNSRTKPAPYAGRYTLIVPGQKNPSSPMGDGFGSVRVSTGGSVVFAGTLADGTKISQGVPLSLNGQYPFYAPLYSGQGLVMSWITLTNEAESDLTGALTWIKPANIQAKIYSGGFSNECQVNGSVYVPPASTNLVLNITNGVVTFSGGNLASNFTNSVALGLGNKVINSDSNQLAMSFSLSTGTFTGKVTDPSSSESFSFSGAVSQKLNTGYGFLLGTNQSSQVILSP